MDLYRHVFPKTAFAQKATYFGKQLKVKWKNAIQRRGKIVKQQTINIVPRYQDGWNSAFFVLPILHQLCYIT